MKPSGILMLKNLYFMSQTKTSQKHLPLRIVAGLGLFAAAIGILSAHRQTLSASIQIAKTAHAGWLVMAAFLTVCTYFIAAASYKVLALHSLRYAEMLLIESSSAFVNRLLPAGIGGLGLHGRYLYKHKHSVAEATAVVSVNNLLGITTHVLLLASVTILSSRIFRQFSLGGQQIKIWYLAVPAAIVGGLLISTTIRHRLGSFTRNLACSIRKLKPVRVLGTLLLSGLLTCTYTLILFCAARSAGLYLTVIQVFIVFSIGVLAGTAVPTPGGLVGVEAGLYTGFINFEASPASAGAAVILYRLITYWLPLLPGYAALLWARRQKLV